MALFDPDAAFGTEAVTLEHLADLIAETTAAQALAEAVGDSATKKAQTFAKIVIGPHHGPWDGTQHTVTELASRLVQFQVYVPMEGGRTVAKSDGSNDRADELGTCELITRRFCRESELRDRGDVYLFFLDCISGLEQQLIVDSEARECPRLLAVTRLMGPSFGDKKTTKSQGEYLWTRHSITWGDQVGDQ